MQDLQIAITDKARENILSAIDCHSTIYIKIEHGGCQGFEPKFQKIPYRNNEKIIDTELFFLETSDNTRLVYNSNTQHALSDLDKCCVYLIDKERPIIAIKESLLKLISPVIVDYRSSVTNEGLFLSSKSFEASCGCKRSISIKRK